jgi:hypothetical protein
MAGPASCVVTGKEWNRKQTAAFCHGAKFETVDLLP